MLQVSGAVAHGVDPATEQRIDQGRFADIRDAHHQAANLLARAAAMGRQCPSFPHHCPGRGEEGELVAFYLHELGVQRNGGLLSYEVPLLTAHALTH